MQNTILIVDDEQNVREVVSIVASKMGFDSITAEDSMEAEKLIRSREFSIAVIDLKLKTGSGMDVLKAVKEKNPEIPSILMTAYGSIDIAVEAMKQGASDFITKPFKAQTLRAVINKAVDNSRLRQENKELKKQLHFVSDKSLIGRSPEIKGIREFISKVSDSDGNILIYGESGTGKGMVARAIHTESPRREKPFVEINCAALPESLLESELFGHLKGSFTGAVRNKEGLFAAANGGTVFLDEIGEIPLSVQAKLLHVVENNRVTPVGGTDPVEVNARIIAATNKNLEKETSSGKFREDLYYRLNVLSVSVPPLRERGGDLDILIKHFLEKHSPGKILREFSSGARELMDKYSWPGNVRELENVIERAVTMQSGNSITPEDLPSRMKNKSSSGISSAVTSSEDEVKIAPLEEMEKAYIFWVLKKSGGKKYKAAEILGIDPSTLYRKMERYGIKGS